MDWPEILHDESLFRKDQVYGQQQWSITCSAAETINNNQPKSQPFLNRLNFAWWLCKWNGSSLWLKQWSYSTTCSAAEPINIRLYLCHFSTDWAEILHDNSLGEKDQVCAQNSDPAALQYYMQSYRTSKYLTAYISAISQWIDLKFCIVTLDHMIKSTRLVCN